MFVANSALTTHPGRPMTTSWLAFIRFAKRLWHPRRAIRDFKLRRRIRRELRSDEHRYYKRDPRDNEETKPPPDEQINLHCVWAVEFYTPRHFDDLQKNLSKLDEALAPSQRREPTLNQWLERSQRHPFSQEWTDLGLLKPPGVRFPTAGRDRTVELPSGVAYAEGSICSVSPRIKYVVIRFVLDPGFSATFHTELSTYRSTEITYTPYGASIKSPDLVKRERIDQTRIRLSRNATVWFSQHLPGLFTDRLGTNPIPICEYIKFNTAEPFPERDPQTPPPPRYLRTMGLEHAFIAWRSPSDPRIKFATNRISTDLPHHHCTVTFTQSPGQGQQKPAEPEDPWTGPDYIVDKTMENVLPNWAALAMLEQYEERLNTIRNEQIHSNTGSRRPVADLEALGRTLTWTADLEGVVDDICEIWQREPGYDLIGKPAWRNDAAPSHLSSDLNMMVKERSQRVKTTLQQVRQEILHLRETISISASIRLQRTMKWLAICSVLLAGTGIALTAAEIDILDLIRTVAAVFL